MMFQMNFQLKILAFMQKKFFEKLFIRQIMLSNSYCDHLLKNWPAITCESWQILLDGPCSFVSTRLQHACLGADNFLSGFIWWVISNESLMSISLQFLLKMSGSNCKKDETFWQELLNIFNMKYKYHLDKLHDIIFNLNNFQSVQFSYKIKHSNCCFEYIDILNIIWLNNRIPTKRGSWF